MRKLRLKIFFGLSIAALAVLILSTPLIAQNVGYAFVYAYSHQTKQAFHSAVFEHPVRSKSLNEKEYVADIKLIRQLEDALEQHLKNHLRIDSSQFSYTARTGYKSEAMAMNQLESDKSQLLIQGIQMKPLPDFSVSP
jgi:hypothetical protein